MWGWGSEEKEGAKVSKMVKISSMWVWGEGTKKRGRVVKIKNGKPWSSGGLVEE